MAHEARRDLVGHMLGQIQHRGPDGWGTWVAPTVALGHVRLSIIDIASGHQPFVVGTDAITYNGEVYNHIELRAELEDQGERFITNSDTEVLLRALRLWGLDALKRVNGQFSFAWWSGRDRRLIAARDRYGVRPLYYTFWGRLACLASEMKAFDVIPGVVREFDPENVLELGLLWNNIGDRTPYRRICTVEPGTALVFESGKEPKAHSYYELGSSVPEERTGTFADAKAMLREKLTSAVRLRLRSDVPVGNYLSGGIDSSVTTWITNSLRADRYKSFAIRFRDSNFDESTYQTLVAERLHSELHTLTIDDSDIEDNFETAVIHGERPMFRTASVPLWLLARVVRQEGIRVVLTGEGADEVLWGYDSFKEIKLLRFWAMHPESTLRPQLIRALYRHLPHYKDPTTFGFLRMFYEGFLKSFDNALVGLNMRVHNNRILTAFMRPEHRAKMDDHWILGRVEEALPARQRSWTLLQRNQYLEMRTLLDGYLLSTQADRMSLAHGVEGRYPFLDHNLVEWVFHLPDEYKLPRFRHKHLLREAFREDLPAAVIDRPKHPYQAPDLRPFVRDGQWSPLLRAYLSPESVDRVGLFDRAMVERFLRKWVRGAPAQIGYRDNMLMCFLLSTQIAAYRASVRPDLVLPRSVKTVDVMERS